MKDWLVARPIAHRGLHDDISPENSMSAFRKAAKAGYPFELDVHLTRDGELAVLHDENTLRMCKKELLITSAPKAEWRALTLSGSDEGIPTLPEVLSEIDGQVGIVIEVKSDKSSEKGMIEQKLAEALKDYGGRYVLKSFDPFLVKRLKKRFQNVRVGQLVTDISGGGYPKLACFLMKHLLMIPYAKPDFISIDSKVIPSRYLERYAKRGMTVLSWTIRDQKEADRISGVADNIIFESFIPNER